MHIEPILRKKRGVFVFFNNDTSAAQIMLYWLYHKRLGVQVDDGIDCVVSHLYRMLREES